MDFLLPALGLALACGVWILLQSKTGRLEDAGGARCGACGGGECQGAEGCQRQEKGDSGNGTGAAAILVAACLALSSCTSAVPSPQGEKRLVSADRMLMGTRFAIQAFGTDEEALEAAIEAAFAEVARVEAPLSEWRDDSEITALNRAAGQGPVAVGPELVEVLQRARAISERTDGAFDVTFAACGGLWSISERRIPAADELAACLALVDWRQVEVDAAAGTVSLARTSQRVGIAGIGKGWGVDRAVAVLREHGLTDFVVDGGGDLRAAGRGPAGPWRVGIRDPRRPAALLGRVEVGDGAIVTSGDYFNSFERDGVIYHHILDPATGQPARRSVAVSVVAPEATEADALATGLFVMGPEAGLVLVESWPGVEALFVTPTFDVRTTSGFPPLHD